jgi:hypothetical protein
MEKMNVHTLAILIAITTASALVGCTSAYTVSEQKLASGDYQGAKDALGSRTGQKAEQIRAQIRERQGQSEVGSDLIFATNAFESKDYLTAHDSYQRASGSEYLSDAQREQALDGLCLTENKIGPSQYSLEQQLGSCRAAAAQPSSAVTAVLSDVERRLGSQYSARIASSIAAKDADNAEKVVGQYRQLPHADQAQIRLWQTQIENILEATRIARSFDAAVHSCDSVSPNTILTSQLEQMGVHTKQFQEPGFIRYRAAGILGCYDPVIKAKNDALTAAFRQREARGELSPIEIGLGEHSVCDEPVYFNCLFEYLQRVDLPQDQIYALGFCADAKDLGKQSVDQCVKNEALTHTRRRREMR